MAKNSEQLKAPECSHQGNWDVAGSFSINYKDEGVVLVTTLFCTRCGEVEVKLNKVEVKK